MHGQNPIKFKRYDIKQKGRSRDKWEKLDYRGVG
jgi:hypothetical protein